MSTENHLRDLRLRDSNLLLDSPTKIAQMPPSKFSPLIKLARLSWRTIRTEATATFGSSQQAKYLRAIRHHKSSLPKMDATCHQILKQLKRHGVYLSKIGDLNFEDSKDLVARAQSLCQYCCRRTGLGWYFDMMADFTERVDDRQIVTLQPELFMWGLQPRLLTLAEHALGIPPAYLGCEIRRDKNAGTIGARSWHKDTENLKIFKICIYLSDVTEDTPAFQYVSLQDTLRTSPGMRDWQTFYEENAKLCTGPTGTIIFALTSDVMHKGYIAPGSNTDRYSIWFDYASHFPTHMETCMAVTSDDTRAMIDARLNQQQRNAVYWFNTARLKR